MSENYGVKFIPVRGYDSKIQRAEVKDGWIYFATDSGKIYVDSQGQRTIMGSAGAAIYYGEVEKPEVNEDTGYATLPKSAVKGDPKKGDLILNSDGGFYKVELIGEENYTCELLSISGTGGGPGVSTTTRPSITLTLDNTNFINGQEAYFHIHAESALEADGVTPVDTTLNVVYSLGTRISDEVIDNYTTQTRTYKTGESDYEGVPGIIDDYIEIGSLLRESSSSVLSVYVQGANHDEKSRTRTVDLSTSALKLSQVSGYNPATRYPTSGFQIKCGVVGSLSKVLDFYYDDMNTPAETRVIEANVANSTQTFTVGTDKATHGYHTVRIELWQNTGTSSNPKRGLGVAPLQYEIAVIETSNANAKPVIWLGDYKAEYYNYDTIQIPFLVWDPANTNSTKVHLYKNNIELESSPREVKDFSKFDYWEIADAEMNALNSYQISCGETDEKFVKREIEFKVVKDPNRDMTVEQAGLLLDFSATGRSNSESAAKRQLWSYTLNGEKKNAIFENFNWYNNGWMMDSSINQSCLRISNGARLTIPFQQMVFAAGVSGQESHTVEMQFRIRNVQKYDNLITNITRYQGDGVWYEAFKAQKDTGYSNYDAYLQATLDPDTYDNLKFQTVEKNINITNVAAGLYDYDATNVKATGFCVGTQDAFFSNGENTVNVNFVEDELINLSFVYQDSLKYLYIYINGVITGVIKSTDPDAFTINSGNFVFDSSNCDIDLYKLRIYNSDLNVNQIVQNFSVDRKNVKIFDQSNAYALAEENNNLKEFQFSYEAMLRYNEAHPNEPLMPYIIYDTGNATLPYSKDDTKYISVEFVNTNLERAYANGELETLARADGLIAEGETDSDKIKEGVRLYYKHHCPSWISTMTSGDKVEFAVQGTSSEFYPRRNYKIKTKVEGEFNWKPIADFTDKEKAELKPEELEKLNAESGLYMEEDSLNIFLNRGPYAEVFVSDKAKLAQDSKYLGHEECRCADGWYMNNYTNGTDRWTMKVDYMESSGSYNAGFASMVGNGYTKHPLQDYLALLNNTNKLEPVVDSSVIKGIQWGDYRTSLLGFPVMAFQKTGSGDNAKYTFIGFYRMLLDKSSTQVLGFKPSKKVTNKLFPKGLNDEGKMEYKAVRDVAECWEFSNNARGYCSYRDPWSRVELSFTPPTNSTVSNGGYNANEAPVVANSFEYRYHSKDDYIDILYNFKQATQGELDEVAEELGTGTIPKGDLEAGAKALLSTHTNWEKVCKWLWSTNLDAVVSQGTYSKVPVGDTAYEPGVYYVVDGDSYAISNADFDENTTYYVKSEVNYDVISLTAETYISGKYYILNADGEYVIDASTFDANKIYYEQVIEDRYIPVNVCPAEYVYVKGKFYVLTAGGNTVSTTDDVYALSNEEFAGGTTYYEFKDDTLDTLNSRFDLLIAPVDIENATYDANTQYYTWHGMDYDMNDAANGVVINPGHPTGAVRAVETPSQEDWAKGLYYVAAPKEYAGKVYTHDTKEYRAAKFTNEFEDHFDPEYVATYFVMTEVMELYDSRGKNCMMASWGPHEAGGEYIWYPIFYDIDTQLGINNTGIPSFEFNVDATEAGNFSTSDSILWNNFYKFFKDTWIVPKYRNLRGNDTPKFAKLLNADGTSKAPLQSVDYIEKWYTFNPDATNNIACEGERPLLATNLDMYFKYITICNPKAKEEGVAHLGGEGSGGAFAEPDTGTYFYALQGDRSQSRQQFVGNRLEYIDSWLTQGNYARGGANRLWGRISANNRSDLDSDITDVHSDKWTNSVDDPYWVNNVPFGTKTHEFDSEYWIEPTPIRSAYVTAGDDSMNYPSKKYDGIHKMQFVLNELENGIKNSDNYPEQLLYIYGTNQMSDFGDLSKMYWTEFKLEGKADKLTRLKLGHDGTTIDYKDSNASTKTEIGWYNKKLNGITVPTSLPLLKEVNFCNIGLVNETALDFSSSEKMENFRATGASNLTSVTFADGVALNTLYLPASVGSLALTQANLLTELIGHDEDHAYEIPTLNVTTDELEANPGLYLEGFFEGSSKMNTVKFIGGKLGYNSYIILKQLYTLNNNAGNANVTMTDVEWCPYTHLTEGDVFDASKKYYIDNGHYGFTLYNPDGYVYNEKQFNIDVLSGGLYRDDGHGGRTEAGEFAADITNVADDAITMLTNLYSNPRFKDASGLNRPNITGVIYINNTTPIEESSIQDTLQMYYPNLTFFFANVTPAYSAKFVLVDKDTGAEGFVDYLSSDGYGPSVQKISQEAMAGDSTLWFTNPYSLYKVERAHWDFYGWSTSSNAADKSKIIYGDINDDMTDAEKIAAHNVAWMAAKSKLFAADKFDYPFYAILTEHEYEAVFLDYFDPTYRQVAKVAYSDKGSYMNDNVPAPVNLTADDLYMRNAFKGWTNDIEKAKVIYGENVPDEELPLINVSMYPATRDYTFYAVYKKESVFANVTDPVKYFNYTVGSSYTDAYGEGGTYDYSNGYILSLKPEYKNGFLKGKITLPTRTPSGIDGVTAGQPIYEYRGFTEDEYITHIFFDSAATCEVRIIYNNFFARMKALKYVDFPAMKKLRVINNGAFESCPYFSNFTFCDPLVLIQTYAFSATGNLAEPVDCVLNPMLRDILGGAISWGIALKTLTIGAENSPSQLTQEKWLKNKRDVACIENGQGSRPSVVTIYCPSGMETTWNDWIVGGANGQPFVTVDSIDNISIVGK